MKYKIYCADHLDKVSSDLMVMRLGFSFDPKQWCLITDDIKERSDEYYNLIHRIATKYPIISIIRMKD
ncbi:hypothetical protein D3C71_1721220 [compost metagenome]